MTDWNEICRDKRANHDEIDHRDCTTTEHFFYGASV